MRHGLCVANVGSYSDPRTVVELGREAEAAGWEALLVWDHLGFVWGPPAADPWVTLAAVAARTSSLLLGTNVTPVPRRRPHVLAHQVATLDVLSGGRVIFGAGIGGIVAEFAAFGEDADARARADRLDEGLEVLRRLWSGERVEHHGRALDIVCDSRGNLDGFDVAVMGYSDQADPSAYADVGATWWLENVHDLRGGVEEMLDLVRRGPSG